MKRCRLILIAAVAVVAAGVGWTWWGGRLTREETRLVGTWQLSEHESIAYVFVADRTVRLTVTGPQVEREADLARGQWRFSSDGSLVIDWEPDWRRRLIRPVAALFGISCASVNHCTTFTEHRIVEHGAGKVELVWTRAPADWPPLPPPDSDRTSLIPARRAIPTTPRQGRRGLWLWAWGCVTVGGAQAAAMRGDSIPKK
jgi:hypothetical protein